MIFLSKEALLYAAEKMAEEHNTIFNIRDEGAFDSALARALNRYEYASDSSVYDLAAQYAFGIAKNHPLTDGNKRLAYVACVLFLRLNGKDWLASEDKKYDAIWKLASSELSLEDFREKLVTSKNKTVLDA